MKFYNINSIFKHLLFWIIFTTYACIIDPIHGTFFAQSIGTFLIILNFSLIYYTETIFILPYLYNKKIILILFLSLLFIIVFSISYFNFFYFLKTNGIFTFFLTQPFYLFIANQLILFSVASVIALGAYQNKIGITEIKLKSKKKKTLLLKELGFMKNQFNSHITFNFLNFCYENTYKSSNETAESIKIFSRMLNHSLNNKVCEKVKLLTEVEYIEDFIKLQRLLSSDVNINFTLSGNDFDRILIFPGILIAPVENAFKHGNLHSEENPIQVELKCSYKYLTLSVLNEKNKHKINEPSGIGNNNLKQQLDLLYKDKYYLSVKNEDCTYSCELKLALS